ncbi:dienelactone hydrolase family protein [Aquihabitans sp. McL0605]|uniref:dienelactone hydrolase family protein n=1 Tax=Aquihabitans sp. McL0605 TaxID=3415671 RepID=UPI003CF52A4F
MTTLDVDVATPDGVAAASLHVPDGPGPWPAVILYPDAGGARDVFRRMGDRLAAEGYVVLVPDIYYRAGGYEPFSMATAFSDPGERQRIGALAGSLTPPRVLADATAYADFLAGRAEVAAGPIGTTGYCLGGRISLTVAGQLGERIGAAASFHGGRLAVAADESSPHQLADAVRAVVYVAGARNDGSFDDAQAELLHEAYEDAGVEHTIETYDALHGFAVPDNPTYDAAAEERHWDALRTLYAAALSPS